jgi:hypothetical protein
MLYYLKGCSVAQLGCSMAQLGCSVAQSGCSVAQLGCSVAQLGCSVAQLGCSAAQLVARWLAVRQARFESQLGTPWNFHPLSRQM